MNCLCSSFIYLLLTCSFLFNLSANETILQLSGSREGDPSSMIEGVSVIHGDYSEREIDLVIERPDHVWFQSVMVYAMLIENHRRNYGINIT